MGLFESYWVSFVAASLIPTSSLNYFDFKCTKIRGTHRRVLCSHRYSYDCNPSKLGANNAPVKIPGEFNQISFNELISVEKERKRERERDWWLPKRVRKKKSKARKTQPEWDRETEWVNEWVRKRERDRQKQKERMKGRQRDRETEREREKKKRLGERKKGEKMEKKRRGTCSIDFSGFVNRYKWLSSSCFVLLATVAFPEKRGSRLSSWVRICTLSARESQHVKHQGYVTANCSHRFGFFAHAQVNI